MAISLDEQLQAAQVYAESLFELARQAGAVDEVRSNLEELVKLEEAEPSVRQFFESAALDDDNRAAALEKMFRGKLHDLTLNTLQVMNRNGRNGLLRGLLAAFKLEQQAAAGQVDVTVTSAVELDGNEKQSVEATAAKISGKKPLVSYKVNPEILGGLVLQIGDVRYDNSVSSKLREAERLVLDRGERGIAVPVTA